MLATHGLLLHGAAHRARTLRSVPAGARRELRRAHLRLLLLLLRRAGYGRRHGGAGALVLGLGLAHVLLLLVLRGGARGGGQLGAQVLVLAQQTGQLGLDLVEEGVDLVLVIAFSQADGRELLVPHVLGSQRHVFFTST